MTPGRIVLGLCFLVLAGAFPLRALEPLTLHSRSRQFVVRGLTMGAPLARYGATSEVSFVRLDPAVFAVSCERIKELLLEELELSDHWRGTIHVEIRPVRVDNEPIRVTSISFSDGWRYQLELPDHADKAGVVRALVQVLLTEIANRRAGAQPAELPAWLVEGLTAHLRMVAPATLTLEPETVTVRRQSHPDPLRDARTALRRQPPLTLDELSWPEDLSPDQEELFRHCAHLFTHELLRLDGGRAALREMLERLPENLNWQTTFLQAFRAHFGRLLDVDKWWALSVAQLTGEERMSAWSPDQTLFRLDEILALPAQVRARAESRPVSGQVNLQSFLGGADYRRQAPVLAMKIQHLQALRLRAAPETLGLIDEYARAIDGYLQERGSPGSTRARRRASSPAVQGLIGETVQRLDALDARRDLLRHQFKAPAAARNESGRGVD